MTAIASAFVFYKLYPKYSKLVLTVLLLGLVIIIPAITQARNMNSLVGDDNTLVNLSSMIQQYLGSPYNIAIAIEAAELFPSNRNIINLIYDIVRPILGLNVLVANLPLQLSTVYFNTRMYLREGHVVQILPMVGQSLFYFGILLSPLLSLIFIKLGDLLTKILDNSNRLELIYFLSITSTRLAFSLGQNATIQMNDLSFTLFVPIILMWLNDRLRLSKKSKSLTLTK
ncbi:hypothetical protein [Alkalibacterium psychrotolerans]